MKVALFLFILVRVARAAISVPLRYFDISFYYLEICVGTPPQCVYGVLDTGSSDTWFSVPGASPAAYCPFCGTFSPEISGSWHALNETYAVEYVSGNVSGTAGLETVVLDGFAVPSLQIASIDDNSVLPMPNLVGVGPVANENVYLPQYANLPQRLKDLGLTRRNLYAVYGGEIKAETGAKVVFGGLDLSKFEGRLATLKCVPQVAGAKLMSYWVTAQSVSIQRNNGPDIVLFPGPSQVLLDTGSSVPGLPTEQYKTVMQKYFGLSHASDPIPCFNGSNYNDTLVYDFGSFRAELPMSDYVFEDSGTCIAGFTSAYSGNNSVVGIPWFQRVYTVFDNEAMKVYVAKQVHSGSERIVDVGESVNFLGCGPKMKF